MLNLEPGVCSEEVATESERESLTAPGVEAKPQGGQEKRPRRKHPGRNELPEHLARIDEIIACTPGQCQCGRCGKETAVIGYEQTELLDVKPAEYYVRVIKREKRACKSCNGQGVETAAAPERICPKSVLSDNVIIDLVVSKYVSAQPTPSCVCAESRVRLGTCGNKTSQRGRGGSSWCANRKRAA